MKITSDNIQFIDTYLENSHVKYIDIRLEMVDHVATAIEAEMNAGDTRDFYYIFKDYMVANKRLLLNDNKQFLKNTDKKLSKVLFKQLLSWQCLLVFVGVFLLLRYVELNDDFSTLKYWLGGMPLVGFLAFYFGYLSVIQYLKLNRFSAVERLSFLFAISFQVFAFCWNMSNTTLFSEYVLLIKGITSFAMALLLAMVLVTIRLIKANKNRYQNIAQ